jgi:hypothetical protein
MFSLTVFLGHGMWQLLYKTEEKARNTFALLNSAPVSPIAGPSGTVMTLAQHGATASMPFFVADDFGSEILVTPTSLHGAVLENMAETALGACERALHQQRTTVKAQALAMADPALKQARYSQGPAVIDPTMRPRGNGQFGG